VSTYRWLFISNDFLDLIPLEFICTAVLYVMLFRQ
jgi:hypothetical protein